MSISITDCDQLILMAPQKHQPVPQNLNFVFIPRGIESKEKLDHLYNEHVKRFYSDPAWRKRFRNRLWQHRKSLLYLLRHLPSFWSAKNQFEPGKE